MTFGQNFYDIAVVDQSDANKMVERALSVNINFFDTADAYSSLEHEELNNPIRPPEDFQGF